MNNNNHMCPVCGYHHLDKPAYWNNDVENGSPSHEICPSCGFQFGWTDHDQHISHAEWREKWIKENMPWSSKGISPPSNWNPLEQLLNIGIKLH